MSQQVYGPLLTGCATAFFAWILIEGFKSGEMRWSAYGVTFSGRRKDQPVRFWSVAIGIMLITAMSLVATLGQIFLPNGL